MRAFSAPTRLRQALEPVLTPLYRSWWRISRGKTLGVRGVACDPEGRVVLVRHTYSRGWSLPGGGVDDGETLPQALAKEMREEAGVELTAAPKLFGIYSNHANFRNDHVALYVIPSWRPIPFAPNREIAECAFFPVSALPDDLARGSRARLQEVFNAAPVADHW